MSARQVHRPQGLFPDGLTQEPLLVAIIKILYPYLW